MTEAIGKRVTAAQNAFARLVVGTVGGSFLIAYEDDLECAKQGISPLERGHGSTGRRWGGESEGEGGEDTKPNSAGLVKLVAFAHTNVVAGRRMTGGGVLLGTHGHHLDTRLKSLDRRMAGWSTASVHSDSSWWNGRGKAHRGKWSFLSANPGRTYQPELPPWQILSRPQPQAPTQP